MTPKDMRTLFLDFSDLFLVVRGQQVHVVRPVVIPLRPLLPGLVAKWQEMDVLPASAVLTLEGEFYRDETGSL
jgi:hypothetical protein